MLVKFFCRSYLLLGGSIIYMIVISELRPTFYFPQILEESKRGILKFFEVLVKSAPHSIASNWSNSFFQCVLGSEMKKTSSRLIKYAKNRDFLLDKLIFWINLIFRTRIFYNHFWKLPIFCARIYRLSSFSVSQCKSREISGEYHY